MLIELEDMPDDVRTISRTPTGPIHEALSVIQAGPEHHGKLKKLAEFKLPSEKGKAAQHKQALANFYGNHPSILGFNFVVTRSVDNTAEYLGVTFTPDKIVAGRWDEFQEAKAEKAEEARERREIREKLKAEAAAEANRASKVKAS